MNPDQPKPMTPEESFSILSQVAAQFSTTGAQHAIIREALLVYSNLIQQTKEPKP